MRISELWWFHLTNYQIPIWEMLPTLKNMASMSSFHTSTTMIGWPTLSLLISWWDFLIYYENLSLIVGTTIRLTYDICLYLPVMRNMHLMPSFGKQASPSNKESAGNSTCITFYNLMASPRFPTALREACRTVAILTFLILFSWSAAKISKQCFASLQHRIYIINCKADVLLFLTLSTWVLLVPVLI